MGRRHIRHTPLICERSEQIIRTTGMNQMDNNLQGGWCPIMWRAWLEWSTQPSGLVRSSLGFGTPGMWARTMSPAAFQSWTANHWMTMCRARSVGCLALTNLMVEALSCSRTRLRKAKFFQDGTKILGNLGSSDSSIEFCFSTASGDQGLGLGPAGNSTSS